VRFSTLDTLPNIAYYSEYCKLYHKEEEQVSVFSESELAYLAAGVGLGRLATVGSDGYPHVVPLGWGYNAELDTIDIGGRSAAEFVATRKFRNVRANPRVAFVVDDVLPPFQPRAVEVRGDAEAINEVPDGESDPIFLIRITPKKVTSWGLARRDS
jgi:pyridoxamine 5'-phosphate oxidase family protein